MNLKLILFFLMILISVNSCDSSKTEKGILGKWYSITKDDGYVEFNITTTDLSVFSDIMGNKGQFEYKIEEDTIRYLNNNFSAKITRIGHEILVLKYKNCIDSLFRLNDSIISFNEINNKNYSAFSNFIKNFQQRHLENLVKHGYTTEEHLKSSFIDTMKYVDENFSIKRN
jgi:hypothetical protein